MKIKILLADDQRTMREALRSLIEKHPDMEIIGEAESGFETVKKSKELRPNVVIMDINMPEMNGLEATKKIKALLPRIKVIALTIIAEKRYVLESFRAGASGYVLKDRAFEDLLRAIQDVCENKQYISPGIIDENISEHIRKIQKKG